MAIVVKKKKGETLGDMIQRFKQLFMDEDIIDEIKEKLEFVKKSRKRYERRLEQERKIRKNS